jgi:hypothetical protein
MQSIGTTMKIFKACTCCDFPWSSRTEFLQDANTELVGYQANFCQLELGYFLFNHLTCESTIAIPAGLFKDMYAGPLFAQRLTGTEVCQGFCDDMDAIEPCDAQCECAYVREIMQTIRNWPKKVPQLANIAQGDDYEVPYLPKIEGREFKIT